jgi:AP-1 complex subunit beta-1
MYCWKHGLQDKRKDAVKKVIAAMTVGKDVSSLFTDVVNCMQTENLELKKLVYLYLINYAKSQPDLAILAVNTFVKVRNYSHTRNKHLCK